MVNLIDITEKQISSHNYSDLELIRYLYLESCKYLGYDIRYDCFDDDYENQMLFRFKNIDLRNIKDSNVICHSWSKTMEKLLKYYNIPCEVKGFDRGHANVVVEYNDLALELDSTVTSDLARVKIGNSTYGFKSLYDRIDLASIDKNIGYIDDLYFKDKLTDIEKSLQLGDYNINVINFIRSFISDNKYLTTFYDIKFTIDYLLIHLLKSNYETCSYFNPCFNDVRDLKFKLLISLKDDTYYLLDEEDNYSFGQITKNKVLDISENYMQI